MISNRIILSKILSSNLYSKAFCIFIIGFYSQCTIAKSDSGSNIFSSEKIANISMVAVGDIMVHDSQLKANYSIKNRKYNFHQSFELVSPYLQGNDFVFGNLETTLPGNPEHYSGYPQFGAPAELAYALKDAGFQILSTANNHSVDKGTLGIRNTLDVLDQLNIKHLGTYRTQKEYEQNRNLILDIEGFKIFFYNYTYGTNGLPIPDDTVVNLISEELISTDLAFAKSQKADAIIVAFHYGPEYVRIPAKDQTKWVDFAIREGADIILGGHPHVLQTYGVEKRTDRYGENRDRLILYSMGNFLSGQRHLHTDGGAIFRWNLLLKNDGNRTFLEYQNVHYIPTWVFPNLKSDHNRFVIIPVLDYMNENGKLLNLEYGIKTTSANKLNGKLNLDKKSEQDMKTFLFNTMELIGKPGLKSI
ncbi:CapA family protein [Leptospira sp. GIMC2001]|uniref:CapA family protein n=1 Tax=Leptospira sp. GIMC2001 TaxID=1513297 RepID=UPI00234B984B|nr:CapA family protein [Leptospira sp. GIMC2001]WCL49540.1 CapA family protein [Leptospira sp. GIMC2001]